MKESDEKRKVTYGYRLHGASLFQVDVASGVSAKLENFVRQNGSTLADGKLEEIAAKTDKPKEFIEKLLDGGLTVIPEKNVELS